MALIFWIFSYIVILIVSYAAFAKENDDSYNVGLFSVMIILAVIPIINSLLLIVSCIKLVLSAYKKD